MLTYGIVSSQGPTNMVGPMVGTTGVIPTVAVGSIIFGP